jgi:predicted adenylyl cyclase CyaB
VMSILNVEIKAKCTGHEKIIEKLKELNARYIGCDKQTDTYFKCSHGRLKLREGNIENALIQYYRPDEECPKRSDITLYKTSNDPNLKSALTKALGVLIEVKKEREIFFVDNVKIHLDKIDSLGSFVEIEAIDESGKIGEDHLRDQCEELIRIFEIKSEDLIECSYSDMLLLK